MPTPAAPRPAAPRQAAPRLPLAQPMGAGPKVKINPHPMIHKNMDTGAETIPHHDRNAPSQQVLRQQQIAAARAQPQPTNQPGPDGKLPMIISRMDGARPVVQNPNPGRPVAPSHAPAFRGNIGPARTGYALPQRAAEPAPEPELAAPEVAPVVIALQPDTARFCRLVVDEERDRLERRRDGGDTDPEIGMRLAMIAGVTKELDAFLDAAKAALEGDQPVAVASADAAPAAEDVPADESTETFVDAAPAAPRGRVLPPPMISAGPTRILGGPGQGKRLPMVVSNMGQTGVMRHNVRPAGAGPARGNSFADVLPARTARSKVGTDGQRELATERAVTIAAENPGEIPPSDLPAPSSADTTDQVDTAQFR